jgi:MYXO-CTERM domain-containing protein
MKWSVIVVSLAAGASGSLCWSAAALAQEAGTEAGSEAGTTEAGATEAGTAEEASTPDSGGTGEAGAGACMLDKDCSGGGGNVCGGDVCSWCLTSAAHCKPPSGATSGVMCVPAASGDPGRCSVDTDCKCNIPGASGTTMSAICCKVGSSFCLPHTCVYHNATFTMPSASSSGSSMDAAAPGDDGGGSSSSGSSSGGSSDNGGGCSVSATASSAFGFGAAAAMLGLALGLRRRR